MRVKEMHPLCCIPIEGACFNTPVIGDESPEPKLLRTGSAVVTSMYGGSDGGDVWGFAGVLYKWTNYGKGWRSRWFSVRNGVLSYSKTPRLENNIVSDVKSGKFVLACRSNGGRGGNKSLKPPRIVHLKISSFRESRSDDRRFYIFTATKTLHLRTYSSRERVVWIEALASSTSLFPLKPFNDNLPILPSNISISTEKLKKRLLEEGISEGLVKDCEQIMLTEFSEVQGQYKVLSEDRCSLLDTLRQLEAANIGIHGNEYQLMKNDFANLVNAKYVEWSTTESSDDVEKQELEEGTYDEETNYFDTSESFSEPSTSSQSIDADQKDVQSETNHMKEFNTGKDPSDSRGPLIERRKKLPDPVEKEKGVSLWSMIKDNVGKDLTRVCLPVYFNEPISSLQRCFEDLEYSYLLDRAYEHGKSGDSLLRILNVAAFAVSGYASTEGRHCKPFNPLLGETYEADYPEKGIRFFSEKVGDGSSMVTVTLNQNFGEDQFSLILWGRSIQLDPVGNRQHSCNLKFKEQSLLDRNPHQVHGFVEDVTGKKVATILGKWNDSLYYTHGEGSSKLKDTSNACLLWKRDYPPENLTRYNLTSFAITLNELPLELEEKLPPTDSRLRPDQRHLENGEYDKANAEKLRLETRQRMSRKLQEDGWKPKWFYKEDQDEAFRFIGGYWEARECGKWDGCPNIFGEISEELMNNLDGS